MATAKLWWNGSSWVTSETTCVDSYPGSSSSWARVRYRIWIAAYDNATIKMQASQGVTVNVAGTGSMSGKKTVKSGGTTIGSGSFTKDVTSYTTFSWSGTVTCGVNEAGTLAWHDGTANSQSGTITISSTPFATITFDANGGSDAPSAQKVCKGVATNLSGTVPTRTDYEFLGWSTSASDTAATYYSGSSITTSSDITLYAIWRQNTFALTITKPWTASVSILKNGVAYSGTTVDLGDVLTVTYSPSAGYFIDSATLNGTAISSGDTHTVAGAVTIVVTTVAQYSTIATYDSVVDTLGTFHLTVNQYDPTHYCKVRYYDSNSTLLDTSAAFTTSTTEAIPQSWFANFASVAALTITAELTTYTDSSCTTQTGYTDSCTFTVNADSTMKPTLAAGCITLSPYNTGTGVASLTSPGYVKGFSKVQAVFDEAHITHASGASTGTYSITVQNTTTSDSPPNTTIVSSNTLTLAESVVVTYRVTDSRGRFAESTQTITVNDYAAPSISAICKRTDSGGTEDDGGTYMSVTPTAIYTLLSNNAVTITLHCKTAGGSYVSYGTITNGATTVFGSGTFSPDSSYVVKVTVTDTVGNSTYIEISMPKRSWDFHIGRVNGNTGAAFGKITEYGNTLQLASGWDLRMGATTMSEAQLIQVLSGSVTDVGTLWLTSVTCSAMTGNFVSVSNASITADHVVAEITFAKSSAITTDVTWTTAAGSLTINGTCSSATTADILLVKKTN